MTDDQLETLRKVSLFEKLTNRKLETVAHAAKPLFAERLRTSGVEAKRAPPDGLRRPPRRGDDI